MSGYPVQSSATHPVGEPSLGKQRKKRGVCRRLFSLLIFVGLLGSIAANFYFYTSYQSYFSDSSGPIEQFHSGNELAETKIAIVKIHGTIMSPNTKRILNQIKKTKNDPDVKGVLLSINSPGGLVSDSHEIYHRLVELREVKPVVVQMKSMAASGGYYVAMGAGQKGTIFAEPTTWTGSIGVIIPRMEMIGLAEKVGVESVPLKTGAFKDALSPFRKLGDAENAVWENILNQSFDRFLNVIADNRAHLDYQAIKTLATGEIYTADDALKHQLIDKIGYEEDALAELLLHADLEAEKVRVVTYTVPPSLMEILLSSAKSNDSAAQWQIAMESTVPRPMYCCTWLAGLTSGPFAADNE